MKKFKKVFAVLTLLMLLSVTTNSNGNGAVPPTKPANNGPVLFNILPPIDTI